LDWQPRAKVSMMNMRPPQQGHGRGSMRGSSAAGQHDKVHVPDRVAALDGCRAGFGGEVGQRLRSARVRYENLVT
jgi:hypothetical protein